MTIDTLRDGEHIVEAYRSITDDLQAASWSVHGALASVGEVHATYGAYRRMPMDEEMPIEEAASSLELLDEKGKFLPGFKVCKAHALYDFCISYDGPFNVELVTAIGRMTQLVRPTEPQG